MPREMGVDDKRRQRHGAMACRTIRWGKLGVAFSLMRTRRNGVSRVDDQEIRMDCTKAVEEMKTRTKRYEDRAKKKMSLQTWPLNKGPLPTSMMDKYSFRC